MKKFNFFNKKDIFSWVNLTFFKKVALLCLGICICMYFFHLRFLLERFPHKIDFSWNLYKFLCYFFLTILFAYVLKRKLYPKISKNKLLIWAKENLFLKISLIYDKALEEVYNFFIGFNRIPFCLDLIHYSIIKLSDFYHKLPYKKTEIISITIFYLITIIPRVIVLFTFLIDVIYFNEYYYLYRIIWVLIIPFIWKIFFYCIYEYHQTIFKTYIPAYLNFTIKEENGLVKIWYNRRINGLAFKNLPVLEEELQQMEKDIYPFYLVEKRFISYYNSNGSVTNAPIAHIISCLITYGYLWIWSYMAINVWLSI